MSEEQMLILDDENFYNKTGSGLILVDFYADWCGPCKMLAPVLEAAAARLGSKATIAKLDIDASHKIAGSFQVTSVPTMILFKDGKEVNRLVGLRDEEAIVNFVLAAQ
ncbi:MAG: thioredoxin [Simkania sp.]|nr:thioredoxin [Simkania sp.]